MHAASLRTTLKAQPFRPIRLHVSDGSSFEIRHPDFCMVGAHDVIIGFPSPDPTEEGYDRFSVVALTHITRWEHVEKAIANPSE